MSDSFSGGMGGEGGSASGAATGGTSDGLGGGTQTGYQDGAMEQAAQDGASSEPDWSKIDLNKHPGFQQHKSTMDRKIEQLNRQYMQTQQILQQEQNRARYYAEELERAQLADKDDFTVLKHNFDKTQAMLQQERMEKQQLMNFIKAQEFRQVVQQEYGVQLPDDINDPQQAILQVTKEQRAQLDDLRKKVSEYERRFSANKTAEDNTLDLGGTQAPPPASAFQREYDAAMLRGDGQTADKLSRSAAERGIPLDRLAFRKQMQRG